MHTALLDTTGTMPSLKAKISQNSATVAVYRHGQSLLFVLPLLLLPWCTASAVTACVMRPYRHGHLSNSIHHEHQQAEEGEAGNLLGVIGADGVHVGAQEEGGSADPQHKDLQGLGFVQHHGALDERELTCHQCLPALEPCGSHQQQLSAAAATSRDRAPVYMKTSCLLMIYKQGGQPQLQDTPKHQLLWCHLPQTNPSST